LNIKEFDDFCTTHPMVSYAPVRLNGECIEPVEDLSEATGLAFRVHGLPWYDNNEQNLSYIPKDKTKTVTPDQLWDEITRGFDVEHITRITGYFTKLSGWNPGKLGELKARHRERWDHAPPVRAWAVNTPKPV